MYYTIFYKQLKILVNGKEGYDQPTQHNYQNNYKEINYLSDLTDHNLSIQVAFNYCEFEFSGVQPSCY